MDWLEDWKTADHAAMLATRAAAAKSLLALQQRGELPSDAERAEVKRLRDRANALLREGMGRTAWPHASAA